MAATYQPLQLSVTRETPDALSAIVGAGRKLIGVRNWRPANAGFILASFLHIYYKYST